MSIPLSERRVALKIFGVGLAGIALAACDPGGPGNGTGSGTGSSSGEGSTGSDKTQPVTRPEQPKQQLESSKTIDQLNGNAQGCPPLANVLGIGLGTDENGCASDKCCGYPPNRSTTKPD
jgi:hypothetical protein